jgi:hypothetical protein
MKAVFSRVFTLEVDGPDRPWYSKRAAPEIPNRSAKNRGFGAI